MKEKLFPFVMVILLVIANSCQNEQDEVPITLSSDQITDEIKSWYKESPLINGKKSKEVWTKAVVYPKGQDKYMVVVPVLAYSAKQIASTYHLIAYRDKNKIQGFIVQVTPDKNELFNPTPNGFSGQVKIKSKQGRQINTFAFAGGKSIPFKKGYASSLRTMDEWDDLVFDGGFLPEVEITGSSWEDDTYTIWIDLGSYNDYIDSSGDDPYEDDSWIYEDYNNDGSPDVGIPLPTLPAPEVPAAPAEKIILSPTLYLKCFNVSQPARLTVYADQPVPNSDDCVDYANPLDVGHTFITITQGGISRTLGFYPASIVTPWNTSANGVLVNDEGHDFDVSASMEITASQLSSLINYISEPLTSYNLNSMNCTSFVTSCSSQMNLPLPQTEGTWFKGGGQCPGAFGEDLRNLTVPGVQVSIDADGGITIGNEGNCD